MYHLLKGLHEYLTQSVVSSNKITINLILAAQEGGILHYHHWARWRRENREHQGTYTSTNQLLKRAALFADFPREGEENLHGRAGSFSGPDWSDCRAEQYVLIALFVKL